MAYIDKQLPADAERNYVVAVAQAVLHPQTISYQSLVDELAANVPDAGYYDVKQLRELSKPEYAVILDANPDALNNIAIEPDALVAILRGQLDAATWITTLIADPLRQWLFDDVCAQVGRNEEIIRQDGMCSYQRRGDAS